MEGRNNIPPPSASDNNNKNQKSKKNKIKDNSIRTKSLNKIGEEAIHKKYTSKDGGMQKKIRQERQEL